MQRFTVYTLSDVDGRPRYVGVTTAETWRRLAWHVASARRGRPRLKADWIREVIAAGRWPQIQTLARAFTAAEAAAIEAAYIQRLRETGAELLNIRDRSAMPSYADRDAISRALRGRSKPFQQRWRQRWRARDAWQRRRAQEAALNARIRGLNNPQERQQEHDAAQQVR